MDLTSVFDFISTGSNCRLLRLYTMLGLTASYQLSIFMKGIILAGGSGTGYTP